MTVRTVWRVPSCKARRPAGSLYFRAPSRIDAFARKELGSNSMKRTFMYALSGCFGLAFLGGIFLILTGNQLGGMLDAFLCMILTGVTLRAAERAPHAGS